MAQGLGRIFQLVKHYTIITLLTILWLLLFPIVFVFIFIPIYLWRLFIQFLKYLFRPDLGLMVSPRSTAMAIDKYLEPNPKCNLVVLIAIEGELKLTEIIQQYKTKVQSKGADGNSNRMKYPEFHQYYEKWMGFLFWKWETVYRAEDHFVYYNPTQPNEPITPEDLPRIEMELIQEPYPPAFSPWKLVVIPNFISRFGHNNNNNNNNNNNDQNNQATTAIRQTLICFKLHHGLADGFSIVNLLVNEVCQILDNHCAKPHPINKSRGQKILDYSLLIVKSPFEYIKQLLESYDENEWRVPEKQMSKIWYTTQTMEPIKLNYIKEIKTLHGVCFTSVIVGAITGGIRNYLLKRRRPIPIVMSSLVPFPMHGFDHTTKLRNFFSFAFLKFPTGIEDSHQRLEFIHKSILGIKKSSTVLTNFWEIPIVARLFPQMVKTILYNRFSTSLLSNFPGPNDPCKFLGKEVTYMGFNAGLLIGNTGVGFMMMSYNGQFTLRINGCQSIFQTKADIDELLNLILQELEHLKKYNGNLLV